MKAARSRRISLGLGCSAAALLAAPASVHAQAFNATPTIRAGAIAIDRSVPGQDTITVSSPSGIIDWALPPSPIDPFVFLPAGTTGIFQNGPNNGDFALLNRIIPVDSVRIRMDGTVIGRLQSAVGTRPGGTVIFSSPTGLIIGAKAVFDVGNLMLTTLDPILDASDAFLVGGSILLAGGDNFPDAAVVTEAGAAIAAPSESSWVALVAPRVDHAGSVRVNGSAAYVGAEAVAITIDQGLFDINVLVGTTQANPIVHRGATGGPASTGGADNHVIAMAATPQNTAITLLLSGSVGFDAAVAANVENGAIVLSAGHRVSGAATDPIPHTLTPASVMVTAGTFSSDVFGRARSDFLAGGTGPGTLDFLQDVTINALDRAHLTADQGFTARVGGSAVVSAANLRPVEFGAVIDIVGGEALLRAGSGATVTVAGSATVNASARGGNTDFGAAGTGTGGRAVAASDKGRVNIAGNLRVVSNGAGGVDPQGNPQPAGAAGNGGTALVSALSGGTFHVGGNAAVEATGAGSPGIGAAAGIGATGSGGTARIEALSDGAVRIDGTTAAVAAGIGGEVGSGAANVGGTGQGGSAGVRAAGGTLDLTGPVSLAANGTGGRGPAGGAGGGGTAFIEAGNGRVTIAAAAELQASGSGGDAAFDPGGRGGNGSGGEVGLDAISGPAAGALTAPSARLTAAGTGGAGGSGGGGVAGGRGGDGFGGNVRATAQASNGRLQIGALTALSPGTGGAGGAGLAVAGGRGGNGSGGDALLATTAGPAPAGGRADVTTLSLTASGAGGAGGSGAPAGAGGDGNGGRATLSSTDAPVTVAGQADLTANGTGGAGPGGALGLAAGGDVVVRAGPLQAGTTGSVVVGTLNGTSLATGSPGAANVLGRWIVDANSGTIRIGTANFNAAANGTPPLPTASEILLRNGAVDIAGQGDFVTQGALRLAADGTGRLGGGNLVFNGRAGVFLNHAGRAAGALTVDAASFTALTDVDYVAAPGTAVLGRAGVDIRAGRDAFLAQTGSNGVASVAAGRDAQIGGPLTGQDLRIVAQRNVTVAAGGSAGDAGTAAVLLQAGANYGAAAGTVVRGGTVAIRAGGDAVLAQTTATGALGVTAGGTARVTAAATGTQVAVTAADVDLAATGSIGDAATATVLVQAGATYAAAAGSVVRGGTVTIGAGRDAVLAQTTATGALGVTAGATARVTAAATGTQVTITSADIDVTATGSIGGANTNVVALQVQPNGNDTTVGGTAQGPGYTLTEAEAGRLQGDIVRVAALAGGAQGPAGSSRIVVRTLTLSAAAARAFELATPGTVRVEGALLLANAGPASRIGIGAGGRVEIVTPAGGVRVRDGGGAPAGTLTVTAGDIWVADAATLGLLAADRDFAGRDAALRTNDGADTPRGWIEAGGVTLAPGASLFVRNSGTAVDFAGVTVGAAGLAIRPNGNTPASVYAFGRRLNADGSFTSNIPFFFQVDYGFGNSAGYTNASEFNRCIINTGRCGVPFGGVRGAPRDLILDAFPIPPQEPPGEPLDESGIGARPLIEEPVTSGSDSTLWTDPDDEDEDEEE